MTCLLDCRCGWGTGCVSGTGQGLLSRRSMSAAVARPRGDRPCRASPGRPTERPCLRPGRAGRRAHLRDHVGDRNSSIYLYSFLPQCTPNATTPRARPGCSSTRRGSEFTTGNDADADRLHRGRDQLAKRRRPRSWRNRVFINPASCRRRPPTSRRRPQRRRLRRHRGHERERPRRPRGHHRPLLRRRRRVDETDGNGYVDDISGWDFYNDQNDPATVDSEYGHANGQMKQAAARDEQRHRRGRHLPEVPGAADQGRRRGARPHRRPRRGLAVRRRHGRRRARIPPRARPSRRAVRRTTASRSPRPAASPARSR